MTRLLVTGGGSGGHVLPAIAVAEHQRGKGWEVLFVGSRSGQEAALVEPRGIPCFGIASGKWRRYFSWTNLTDTVRVLLGILQALWLVRRQRPSVVFSKGGFVAFPVVVAAWCWRIPVVAHESDATQGLANRLSAPFIDTLCTSFADSVHSARYRVVHTGTPLRPELLAGDAARGRDWLGVPAGMPVLLVTGGSLGAARLNEVLREALPQLTGWYVVHVCGPGKLDSQSRAPHYRAFEFVDERWPDLLAAADLVVSRAGANALFELLALRKPNLLVPLPLAGSRGDQLHNAEFARLAGYSEVLPQEALGPERLVATVSAMAAALPDWRARLAAFEPPAALEAIAAELERVLEPDSA